MNFDHKKFGERLRVIRKAKGKTGAQLSNLIGLQRTTIVNLEAGYRGPSVEALYKLAKVLKVSADHLLGLPAPAPVPDWVAGLLPELESLDRAGREAVKAVIISLSQRNKGGPKA
jgi:transcriptional regulator with XRE-family HTH domain